MLLGNGDGTFQTVMTYSLGLTAVDSLTVADVNGDGKPDLLVGSSNGIPYLVGSVGVLLGNGDGTFQTVVSYGTGMADGVPSVAVADVNADGKADLLVANFCAPEDCGNSVGVLLGNGDGTFQTVVTYGMGGSLPESVAVADVNGDGKPDLLVAGCCIGSDGFVSVLLGKGDGTFQPPVSYDSGGGGNHSVAVADVNGDGKPDLLVANQGDSESSSVGVLLGNGDGTFQAAATYGDGTNPFSVVVGDFNGDGKLDLAVAEPYSSNAGVLLGNGDGTFETLLSYNSGGYAPYSVAVADVNGDGKPDLLAANGCVSSTNCANGTVGVLINNSLGSTTTALGSSSNPSSFGQAVTFTATVTSQGFKGQPTGTVSFLDGTTNLGNSPLNGSGAATLTISTLAVGTHSITAVYNGDANFAPSTSPVLYQVVQGAVVALSPTSLNFGNQTVGITSPQQVSTLTNTGNVTLTITSIGLTGTNTNDFAQTNNCPSSLQPNGSCNISATFTPTTTGSRNAAVSIADNAPNSPQSVALSGVGVLPTATFSPTSLSFPTQVVFTSSSARPVTLTNNGLGTLLISKIAAKNPFSQTNNCPSSVAPGAKCTISVKFDPGSKGVFHGVVSVTDNAPDSPQKVPLTGTGTYVQLAPPKLNFGTQPVGTRSGRRRITLTNKGDSVVNLTGISITGADARDFFETNNCGNSVPSGASCLIQVTFKPLAKGKRTADVVIRDDGGGSPQKVPLTGTGT